MDIVGNVVTVLCFYRINETLHVLVYGVVSIRSNTHVVDYRYRYLVTLFFRTLRTFVSRRIRTSIHGPVWWFLSGSRYIRHKFLGELFIIRGENPLAVTSTVPGRLFDRIRLWFSRVYQGDTSRCHSTIRTSHLFFEQKTNKHERMHQVLRTCLFIVLYLNTIKETHQHDRS